MLDFNYLIYISAILTYFITTNTLLRAADTAMKTCYFIIHSTIDTLINIFLEIIIQISDI
jgi:hypothetical protein